MVPRVHQISGFPYQSHPDFTDVVYENTMDYSGILASDAQVDKWNTGTCKSGVEFYMTMTMLDS